jgi:hypothetical protein
MREHEFVSFQSSFLLSHGGVEDDLDLPVHHVLHWAR